VFETLIGKQQQMQLATQVGWRFVIVLIDFRRHRFSCLPVVLTPPSSAQVVKMILKIDDVIMHGSYS